jgi:ribonuclease P protein component
LREISLEANVPAEHPPTQAQARLPRADGDAAGPRHHQAPASERAQAPLGVKRRHRLSRSRDFDAVYRQGRSVATRYLVLYSFPREEPAEGPRLGLAVSRQLGGATERNRMKRRLRAAFDELSDELPAENDYVLIARPGLPELVETRGFPWLRERVQEIFRRAAA